ncbi:MAG: hypothetical protein HQ522_07985 [Bacteroidetes bacterium]|nr:hypothetical protein [Bacteroidota bacterium]
MIKEGYFNDDGTWGKQNEVLLYLINKLDSHGFFKRRTSKGRWYSMNSYACFFESRYGVNLDAFLNYGGLAEIEEKEYLSWLEEYLV